MPAINSPGIYRITHKPSGAAYIGGTKNIRRRWAEHRSMLGRGVHWITKLQDLFNTDGAHSLLFEVVEELQAVSLVLTREQHWIDSDRPRLNTSPTAGSCAGAVLGPLSDEHKAKLSSVRRGVPLPDWQRKFLADINRNKTPEHCAKISASKRGKRASESARANMSAARLGTKASEEARRAISDALKGKPKSEAHKAALSEARKKWWAAKKAITCPSR